MQLLIRSQSLINQGNILTQYRTYKENFPIIGLSQSLINQGNILTFKTNFVFLKKKTILSQSLINQGNILTPQRRVKNEEGKFFVAIPYKSGKYSYLGKEYEMTKENLKKSQSLINQGNILTLPFVSC